ncbi:MAG: cupredoxin domain-containing protein [Gemmatimonadales bacterium]
MPFANVEVRNDVFVPETVVLQVGGTVTWNWIGIQHSVTSVLSPMFAPSSAVQNAPFTHGPITFNTPGTYHYICTVHGSVAGGQTAGMRGMIIVQ